MIANFLPEKQGNARVMNLQVAVLPYMVVMTANPPYSLFGGLILVYFTAMSERCRINGRSLGFFSGGLRRLSGGITERWIICWHANNAENCKLSVGSNPEEMDTGDEGEELIKLRQTICAIQTSGCTQRFFIGSTDEEQHCLCKSSHLG